MVFIKPVMDEVDGEYQYLNLVKRCIGVPGDPLHLHGGVVYINGVAQPLPKDGKMLFATDDPTFLDEFPAVPPVAQPGSTPESWAIDFPNRVKRMAISWFLPACTS